MCVDVDGWTWKMFSCLKKRLHNLYLTSTFEQAACCTLSRTFLAFRIFCSPTYSLTQTTHCTPRNILWEILPQLSSAIDFGVGISCHQLATCKAHFPDKFQSHHLSLHYFPILALSNNQIEMARLRNGILTSLVNWMCYSVQTNSKQPMHCSCRNWKHTKSRCISAEIQSCFLFAICFKAARDMQGRDLS